nr:hypothetical protein CFP56_20634 [Quercus suber]
MPDSPSTLTRYAISTRQDRATIRTAWYYSFDLLHGLLKCAVEMTATRRLLSGKLASSEALHDENNWLHVLQSSEAESCVLHGDLKQGKNISPRHQSDTYPASLQHVAAPFRQYDVLGSNLVYSTMPRAKARPSTYATTDPRAKDARHNIRRGSRLGMALASGLCQCPSPGGETCLIPRKLRRHPLKGQHDVSSISLMVHGNCAGLTCYFNLEEIEEVMPCGSSTRELLTVCSRQYWLPAPLFRRPRTGQSVDGHNLTTWTFRTLTNADLVSLKCPSDGDLRHGYILHGLQPIRSTRVSRLDGWAGALLLSHVTANKGLFSSNPLNSHHFSPVIALAPRIMGLIRKMLGRLLGTQTKQTAPLHSVDDLIATLGSWSMRESGQATPNLFGNVLAMFPPPVTSEVEKAVCANIDAIMNQERAAVSKDEIAGFVRRFKAVVTVVLSMKNSVTLGKMGPDLTQRDFEYGCTPADVALVALFAQLSVDVRTAKMAYILSCLYEVEHEQPPASTLDAQ